ncbi:MAG: segregation and condensation protein A [Pirellulaceae bacterium]|jgi:segregation and condensation protein A
MNFRVELDIFRGPMDLLLYLVRKHEVPISDIPIAKITNQYLEYIEILEQMDVNSVGDFIDLASNLIEIKSRLVLPKVEEEVEEFDDTQEALVERLLQYKKYKDAASMLEEQSRSWQQRYTRVANDLPAREVAPADQPIQEVELWDLVSAFGRIMRENQVAAPSTIIYDDTPIHVYMQRIHEKLLTHKRAALSEMFVPGMHKSAMIGVFLAILELVRHHSVRTKQEDTHGEIWVLPGETLSEDLDVSSVDNYGVPINDPAADSADERAENASRPAEDASTEGNQIGEDSDDENAAPKPR